MCISTPPTAALPRFLTGWTSFVAGFTGAIAANAFFMPIYLARFIPGVGQPDAYLHACRCRTSR